jgi:predicted PurR-regulated permease PerM
MHLPDISPLPQRPAGRRQAIASSVLSLALLGLGLYTLRNFVAALAWAGIFAIALWPLYRSTQRRLGGGWRDSALAGAFTLGVALIFLAPLALAAAQIAREASGAADWLRDVQQNGIPEPALLHQLPFGQAQVDAWWQQTLADPGSARDWVQRSAGGRIGGIGRQVGTAVIHGSVTFTFTLLTLFFLFRGGGSLAAQCRLIATRLFGPGGERVGQQMIASVHGTVNGVVLVSLGEGVLLGGLYAIAGVPHAAVFGALTAVAAVVPFAAVGVFAIVALLLVAQGALVWAVAVFAIATLVNSLADHFVRPVLIGGATRLPFLWVLLGILGGVEAWGLIGLFLGPAILAALILLWREWAAEEP